jgi:hypothetical protein
LKLRFFDLPGLEAHPNSGVDTPIGVRSQSPVSHWRTLGARPCLRFYTESVASVVTSQVDATPLGQIKALNSSRLRCATLGFELNPFQGTKQKKLNFKTRALKLSFLTVVFAFRA